MTYTRLKSNESASNSDIELVPLKKYIPPVKPIELPPLKKTPDLTFFQKLPDHFQHNLSLLLDLKTLAHLANTSHANQTTFNLAAIAQTELEINSPALVKACGTLKQQSSAPKKLLVHHDTKKLRDLIIKKYLNEINPYTYFKTYHLFKYACENYMIQLIYIIKNMHLFYSEQAISSWQNLLGLEFQKSIGGVLHSLSCFISTIKIEDDCCWQEARGTNTFHEFKRAINNLQSSKPQSIDELIDIDNQLLNAIKTCWENLHRDHAHQYIAEFKKKIICTNNPVQIEINHHDIIQMTIHNHGGYIVLLNTLKALLKDYPSDIKSAHFEKLTLTSLRYS